MHDSPPPFTVALPSSVKTPYVAFTPLSSPPEYEMHTDNSVPSTTEYDVCAIPRVKPEERGLQWSYNCHKLLNNVHFVKLLSMHRNHNCAMMCVEEPVRVNI